MESEADADRTGSNCVSCFEGSRNVYRFRFRRHHCLVSDVTKDFLRLHCMHAFDTFGEVTVVAAAALGLWSLTRNVVRKEKQV